MQVTKNSIFLVIGTVFLFGALLWIGKPTEKFETTSHANDRKESVQSVADALAAAESLYDFGVISMKAGRVSHRFRLKNEGTKEVTVKKIYTSCMCTSAVFQKDGKRFGPFGMRGHGIIPSINQQVQPGEEVQVDVIFDPAAHGPAGVGYAERVVYLETSAGTQELMVRVMVKP